MRPPSFPRQDWDAFVAAGRALVAARNWNGYAWGDLIVRYARTRQHATLVDWANEVGWLGDFRLLLAYRDEALAHPPGGIRPEIRWAEHRRLRRW